MKKATKSQIFISNAWDNSKFCIFLSLEKIFISEIIFKLVVIKTITR